MKLENWLVEPFKVPIIKAEYVKNVFRGHFPTEHNRVTDDIKNSGGDLGLLISFPGYMNP